MQIYKVHFIVIFNVIFKNTYYLSIFIFISIFLKQNLNYFLSFKKQKQLSDVSFARRKEKREGSAGLPVIWGFSLCAQAKQYTFMPKGTPLGPI